MWADFGDDGYAILRQFDADLYANIENEPSGVVVLTGTAGSGKSATLMRFGLRLDAAGRNVRWLNVEAETTIARIRAAFRVTPPDVLLIDDFDVFGGSAGRLLLELEQDLPDALIIAAVRSSKYELLELADTAPGRELTVPHLADSDIDDLLDALTNAGRLGELRGMSRSEQQKVFRRKANRQLLVAMIEATSGRRFDEKVESECRDLGTEAGLLYAIVAIATLHRHAVTRQDVLLAAGDASNETLNRLREGLAESPPPCRGGRVTTGAAPCDR